ncbi:uncharacterized protein LOC141691253 [Apium graveolens]|uniref:uncharacterized protein LOC141691253 n=1 Tax=Apium graveolens TaxID=4045 RepID=UPI003D7BC5D0
MCVHIATGFWGIWHARNLKVWKEKQVTPELAMQWSSKMAPEEGRVKLNVDASVVTSMASFSIRMIVRNHNGEFICAQNIGRSWEVSVFEAEAWGVLEVLKCTRELRINTVDIETDSLLMVNAITKRLENY